MTFNQSKYILDALNGFVMQQTNFPFVVMVVDDASTDGEQEVIKKFVAEQFDINDTAIAEGKETDYAYITYARHKMNKSCYIAALYLKENHYSRRKSKMPYLVEWRNNIKYEALCEGDDYWTDPLKLQKQVDFLEENPEYTLTCHRYDIYDQEEKIWKDDLTECFFKGKKGISFTYQTQPAWLTKTLSLVYRLECLEDFFKMSVSRRDIILVYFLLKFGKGYCFNEKMGVYRLNNQGICGKQPMYKVKMDSYIAYKSLYQVEKNVIVRKRYYSAYTTVFFLSKGKILFKEKFDFRKMVSILYYMWPKVFRLIRRVLCQQAL